MYLYRLQQKSPQLTSYSYSPVPPPLPYASHHLASLYSLLDNSTTPLAQQALSVQSTPRSANPLRPCSMYPFPLTLLVEPPSLWQPSVIASPAETRLDIPLHSLVSPPLDPDHRRMSTAPNLTEKTLRLLPVPTTCGISSRPTNGNLTSGATTRTRGCPHPSQAQQLAQQQQTCIHLT